MLSAVADMGAVIEIFLASEGAEGLLFHHFGEADDGIERRAKLVAHIREELRFRLVRRFGFGFLLEIFVGELGELPGLGFEDLARLAQVGHRRHQPALRIEQLLFVVLQGRDVGADRNIAAVLGGTLVDLQPSAVGEAHFVAAHAGLRPMPGAVCE